METQVFRGVGSRRSVDGAAFIAAVVYMVITGWAMTNLSYDLWGGLIALPLVLGCGAWLLNRTFTGEIRALLPFAMVGLVAKMGGTLARYWVVFDAYAGQSDASRYHLSGKLLALQAREGQVSLLALIPHEVGTAFLDRFTGLVYTIAGSSQLAGFMLFASMSFCGQVLFLKAGIIGIRHLSQKRYALACLFTPSVVFWPSSIGKEAWMCLCLGMTSWGGARLLTGVWRSRTLATLVCGLVGAAFVRPHMAALWMAGLILGLVAGLITGRTAKGVGGRIAVGALAAVAVVALVIVGTVALKYLNPENEAQSVTNRVGDIFNETTRRSDGGGSAFQPINVRSPLDWPIAIQRTLLRPSPQEINSVSSAFPGLESLGLIAVLLVGWRRILALPAMLRRNPYLVACLVTTIGFGLAFSTLANLAILTRQRSLVFPLMLLLWCLPRRKELTD
jgi:hypothetical protein